MPKNKGKGGKNRRRGKNENETEKRELVFKEDGQEYAQVIKMLGNGRLEAMCFDGMKRLCHIRGKLRKKVWINQGDIILVGLRDYQDAKADVILKYNPDEARNLKSYGELPEHAKINDTVNFGEEEEDDNIEFDEVSGDEDIEGVSRRVKHPQSQSPRYHHLQNVERHWFMSPPFHVKFTIFLPCLCRVESAEVKGNKVLFISLAPRPKDLQTARTVPS
ncbi:eukaryotic translation initiation factor 1A, X-chromosomal [Rhipicephalus sanguineus]|uniref:eukaryotic translation initiation factor 1A, X-chromosomal n=1 Tax=Rhipicephalus sanguineus TaxID=34632 RepID=UPI0020C3926A|nr:eukaryotic translation initiation factor 1A, X-chromosomal [Rhipicephalus sanguineus]